MTDEEYLELARVRLERLNQLRSYLALAERIYAANPNDPITAIAKAADFWKVWIDSMP